LAEIEVDYAGTAIKSTEQDCIGVVFATAAEKYKSVLTSEQHTKGADLTMDDLEDSMNQLWRQGGGSQKKHTGNDGGEMMLAAFEGTCYNFQEKGHRAKQCPKKDGPSNGNRNASGNTRGKFKGGVTTAARSGTRSLIVGSLRKIRTSARRTIAEETPNMATLRSAVAPETTTGMPSF
jgi:hypothetical protein